MSMPESQTSDVNASEDLPTSSPEMAGTPASEPEILIAQDTEGFSPSPDIDFQEGDVTPEPVSEEILAQLAEKAESLQTQLDERTSQYMRLAADFENFRRRTEKEKEDLEQQVKRKTLSELLPVVDSFDLARSQIKPQTDAETSIHKSYQGVYKQLVDCLKRIGVAPMRSEGKPFDPNMHEAVLRQPTDEYPEGTVMEELKRGYLLGDRVLRHAMVKVSATPEVETVADNTPE